MKMITWILCLCFTMNVFASSGLSEVVDDYNYTMNVEWDQIDRDFYNAQTEIFVSRVQALLDNGLTNKEVEQFVSSRIKDKKSLDEFAAMAKNAKSTQDLVKVLGQNSGRYYDQGANWSGAVIANTIIASIAAVYVIYVVYKLTHLEESTGHSVVTVEFEN